MADLSRAGSAASMRIDAVVGRLEGLGYDVRMVDVDLGERGQWRGVVIGAFGSLEEANAEAGRLRETTDFGDATVIRR